MTNTTPMTPAALAVMDAFRDQFERCGPFDDGWELCIAAALRAAADQAIPLTKTPWGTTLIPVLTSQESRDRLLAIAAELEGR